MMRSCRMLTTTRALHSDRLSSSSSSSSSTRPSISFPRKEGEKRILPGRQGGKRVAVSSEATIILTEKQHKPPPPPPPPPSKEGGMRIIHFPSSLAAEAARAAVRLSSILRLHFSQKCWRLTAEMLAERVITGCQSFTLIGVAGSLIGSILCFVEGCFLVLESFCEYFRTPPTGHPGEIIQLLIEAIDMFLVGSALLTFGMSLCVMFTGSREMKRRRGWPMADSSFFGLFNLKRLPACMEVQSISQAKSKIGHAVVLILQAGVLDKFKNVPLVSGLDLACFAAAVLPSSACVFLLSKLTMPGSKTTFI